MRKSGKSGPGKAGTFRVEESWGLRPCVSNHSPQIRADHRAGRPLKPTEQAEEEEEEKTLSQVEMPSKTYESTTST